MLKRSVLHEMSGKEMLTRREAHFWKLHDHLNEVIKFSDTKALAVITIFGAAIIFFFTYLSHYFEQIQKHTTVSFIVIATILSGLASIYFSFKCVSPRFAPIKNLSPIYFRHISQGYSLFPDFWEKTNEILAEEDALAREIAFQVKVLSGIAEKKFIDIAWSVRFLISTILLGVLSAISIYLMS